MNIFYLVSIIIGMALQNVTKKAYNEKTGGGGVYSFSGLTCLAAAIFFVISSRGFEWNAAIIPYAIAFAFAYAVSTVFGVIALECGSLSLTALIISYSLIIPTIYGLLFLHDPVSKGFYPGLILLLISLVMINQKSESVPITLKWVVCVVICFLGNGVCTVSQKMQQMAFEGAYKNEFMIIALVIVVVSIGIFAIKYERKQLTMYVQKGWILGIVCGVMNGMVNLFVMILSGRMATSLMFPLISAGGIVVTYIIAKVIYHEKLSRMQGIGYAIGVLAVVFLNI